ncbi:MAG: ATPase [Pseudomonadota bacterium]
MVHSPKNAALTALPLALALMAASLPSAAEVVNISPSGFLLRHEIVVNLTPEQAYKTLVNDIGSWWNSAHTYSGNAKNLSIDARPGGCFCEQLPNGGGVQHLAVVTAMPGKLLRLSGALGPMQGSGLAGSMSWQISAVVGSPVGSPADKPASKIEMTYSVGGYMQGGFDKMAPAANGMLAEQIGRLKNFANTGKPEQ